MRSGVIGHSEPSDVTLRSRPLFAHRLRLRWRRGRFWHFRGRTWRGETRQMCGEIHAKSLRSGIHGVAVNVQVASCLGDTEGARQGYQKTVLSDFCRSPHRSVLKWEFSTMCSGAPRRQGRARLFGIEGRRPPKLQRLRSMVGPCPPRTLSFIAFLLRLGLASNPQ